MDNKKVTIESEEFRLLHEKYKRDSLNSEERYMEIVHLVDERLNELADVLDESLNVFIWCCVPAGGVDDRKAILEIHAKIESTLKKIRGE